MKDGLELSENVLLGLRRIQEDIPELRKLKEESYKNLSATEIKIENLKNVVDQAEKKSEGISAVVSEIKQVSQDGLAQIKTESEKAERALKKLKKSIDENKLNKEVEDKLKQIENLVEKHAEIFDTLMRKTEAMDSKMAELEERLKSGLLENAPQATTVAHGTSDALRIPQEIPSFPKNAYRFSFDDIESVKSTKPYGIVFGEKSLACRNWTDMLKLIIKYGFDNYEIDIDDLCNRGYGMESYDGEFIPYFVSGSAPSKKYTYIAKQNLSVFFSGADPIVDVIHDFLCDYIGVEESKVTVFYHDK